MVKTFQLIIRACKSPHAERRLLRLYKMFWYAGSDVAVEVKRQVMMEQLSLLTTEYLNYTVYDFLKDTHPTRGFGYGLSKDFSQQEIQMAALISKIRYAKISRFVGFEKTGRFKEKD